MKAPNPIDVVELAYDLDASPNVWLEQLMHTLYPLLDGKRGMMAYFYDFSTTPDDWLMSSLRIGIAPNAVAHLRRMMGTYRRSDIEQFQTAPAPLETIGAVSAQIGVTDPRQNPGFASCMRDLGARDMLSFRTVETGGKGIVLCAPQHDNRSLDRRTKSLWAKVSAHVAAARRLRESLTSTSATDAVLTPSGKLEHAEGETKSSSAREALRAAVLRQERARGRARREDPDGATEMWTALVGGRWSLVDHFERGGRRYIVARRNEHAGPDPRAMGARERDVAMLAALGKSNKLIAYELGIAESTVASHLGSAMRKLGVKSRVELLRLLMGAAAPAPPESSDA